MGVESVTSPVLADPKPIGVPRRSAGGALGRVAVFAAYRSVTLLVTVVVGVYITILIANMGGHVDTIRKAYIHEIAATTVMANPDWASLTPDERKDLIANIARQYEESFGLDQPFAVRSFRYLAGAMSLNLGKAEVITSDTGSRQVRLILLERLAPTLLLFATANLLLFFVSVFVALVLSRRYGSFLDRLTVSLAPTSAAPSWFYGIFLILIFAAILRLLPFGGMVAAPPPTTTGAYMLSLLKHLILPVSAIVMSSLFNTIYYWRSFFLIYSSEDYVEMAKAKGLPSGVIERRHILRPTLPTLVTSFALTIIRL